MQTPLFNDLWVDLSRKEKAAVLYAVKNHQLGYSHIHLGQLPFLSSEVVVNSMKSLKSDSITKEIKKVKPALSSKVATTVLSKLNCEWLQESIVLDRLKVQSQIREPYMKEVIEQLTYKYGAFNQ